MRTRGWFDGLARVAIALAVTLVQGCGERLHEAEPALPGSTIRLEQDPSIKRIVAVTVLRDGGSLQLRAFAAPRSGD